MTLKKATTIAIICILVEAVWSVFNWIVNTFDLILYENAKWFYKIWIIPNIFFYTGILIFFFTLKNKQKGENNG